MTIDPERDSPEDIDNYAKGFNKNFIGVRGERPMLLSLGTQLAINNMMPNHDDHSNKHDSSVHISAPSCSQPSAFFVHSFADHGLSAQRPTPKRVGFEREQDSY